MSASRESEVSQQPDSGSSERRDSVDLVQYIKQENRLHQLEFERAQGRRLWVVVGAAVMASTFFSYYIQRQTVMEAVDRSWYRTEELLSDLEDRVEKNITASVERSVEERITASLGSISSQLADVDATSLVKTIESLSERVKALEEENK